MGLSKRSGSSIELSNVQSVDVNVYVLCRLVDGHHRDGHGWTKIPGHLQRGLPRRRATVTTVSCKNGASLSRMNLSWLRRDATICNAHYTACCLVVELGLRLGFGLDFVSFWLVVMHTYLYYSTLSQSHCRLIHLSDPTRPNPLLHNCFQSIEICS